MDILLATWIWAQQDAQPAEGPSFLVSVLPIILLFIVLWFLLSWSERRRSREQAKLLGSLKKNDKVIFAGGLIGTIANIRDDDNEVIVKVDDNVRLRILKASIQQVVREEPTDRRQDAKQPS
ncbi:MAG: preprotein translocase subunit YajC [Gemmataceae bacterium]